MIDNPVADAVLAALEEGRDAPHSSFAKFEEDLDKGFGQFPEVAFELRQMYLYGDARSHMASSQLVHGVAVSKHASDPVAVILNSRVRLKRLREVVAEKKELRARARKFRDLSVTERAKVMSSLFTRSVIEDEADGGGLSPVTMAIASALVYELDEERLPADFVALALSF